MWYRYVAQPNGTEKRQQREKIITQDLAEKHRIATDYAGPLTKADAQKVLDLLIAEDAGTYVRLDTAATFEELAHEYITINRAHWGPHTTRTSINTIEVHLIGKLGSQRVSELDTLTLQRFLNRYVSSGGSKSLLSKLVLYLRSIVDLAVMKNIISSNPARNPGQKLRAKSHTRSSNRSLDVQECRSILSALSGRDRLICRIFLQAGLRPEEMFALRRDDVSADALRVDEAIVEGEPAPTKSIASEASVYLPPNLSEELQAWLEGTDGDSSSWLFPAHRGGPIDAHNYLNRVLKPAAARAKVKGVNFTVLRRTCGKLFGGKARDPRLTQAQLRHSDPQVTLRHYQQAIPGEVKAAAIALEADLIDGDLMGSESQRIQ